MDVIVLAGGSGTRLAAAVPSLPKALAPVGGRPFLELLLSLLRKKGFNRAILSLGYKSEMIQTHLGANFDGLELLYAVEKTPLGTGGATRAALKLAQSGPVFVVNGDTIADLDYGAMSKAHLASRTKLTIGAVHIEDTSRYGRLAVSDGHVIEFLEKKQSGPGLINSGTYLLDADIFDPYELPESFSIENGFFAPHLKQLRPLAFETHGYFIDIGVPEDLARAQTELAKA
jgi:D-glycero-alpha-D-manno-heptose 1-phosphate guanylyltransferase